MKKNKIRILIVGGKISFLF